MIDFMAIAAASVGLTMKEAVRRFGLSPVSTARVRKLITTGPDGLLVAEAEAEPILSAVTEERKDRASATAIARFRARGERGANRAAVETGISKFVAMRGLGEDVRVKLSGVSDPLRYFVSIANELKADGPFSDLEVFYFSANNRPEAPHRVLVKLVGSGILVKNGKSAQIKFTALGAELMNYLTGRDQSK